MEHKKSSESLAAVIVVYRTLGLFKNDARNAMIELMIRKNNGDLFDYEQYISEKIKDLPKSQVSQELLNMLSILSR